MFKTPKASFQNSSYRENSLRKVDSVIDLREKSLQSPMGKQQRIAKSPVLLRQEGRIFSPKNFIEDGKIQRSFQEQLNKRHTIATKKTKNKLIMENLINKAPITFCQKVGNVVSIDIMTSSDTLTFQGHGQQLNINTSNNSVEAVLNKENPTSQTHFHLPLSSLKQSQTQKTVKSNKVNPIQIKNNDYEIQKSSQIVEDLYEIIQESFQSVDTNIQMEDNDDQKRKKINQKDNLNLLKQEIKVCENKSRNENNQVNERTKDSYGHNLLNNETIMTRSLSGASLNQSNASKMRRTRKDRVQQINQQIIVERESSEILINQEEGQLQNRNDPQINEIKQIPYQKERNESIIKAYQDVLNNTNEVPSPLRMAPQPQLYQSENKKCELTHQNQQHNELKFQIENQGFFSQRQSNLLKTPRLINKSRQYRQKTYSTTFKDEKPSQFNFYSEGIKDDLSIARKSSNDQKNQLKTSQSIKNLVQNQKIDLIGKDMSLQFQQNKIQHSQSVYQNEGQQEKFIKNKKISLRDLDDTLTFIKLEEQIKEQIKTKLLDNQNVRIPEDQVTASSIDQSDQKDLLQQNPSLNKTQKSLSLSTMQLIKFKLELSIKQSKFDIKLVRQLENEAVKVIQNFIRNRNQRVIKPLRNGRNMSTQTELLSKQDQERFKQKMIYAWIIVNMAVAAKNKLKQPLSQNSLQNSEIEIQTFENSKEIQVLECSNSHQFDDKILDSIKVSIVQNNRESKISNSKRDRSAKNKISQIQASPNVNQQEKQNQMKSAKNSKNGVGKISLPKQSINK